MALKWKYSVTFESDTQPPETLFGEVQGSVSGAIGRAIRAARKRKPTKNRYQSVVVVVERQDGGTMASTSDPLTDTAEM